MRILLVEDAEGLGEVIQDQIADEGHAIDWVQSISHAEASLRTTHYDLILLDLMLPDGSGIDLLKQVRKSGEKTPVIILTARDQLSDRINGLNAGADDYLVKPFDLSELSARIAAVSRRYAGNPSPKLQIGTLEVDLTKHLIYRDGVSINLTAREWALFEAFIQRPGTLLSKSSTIKLSRLIRSCSSVDKSPPPSALASCISFSDKFDKSRIVASILSILSLMGPAATSCCKC